MFSLLMPTFSLLSRPSVLSIWLRPTTVRSPTHIVNYMTQFRLYALVPVYFRRGVAWPVSYYALFQGMAASKPTSWLSQQLYLLNHLAYIRDLNWRSGLFPSWPWILSLIASLLDITLQAFGVWHCLVHHFDARTKPVLYLLQDKSNAVPKRISGRTS